LGGRRGQLIVLADRQMAVELIAEANQNGARLVRACEEFKISRKTYGRWQKQLRTEHHLHDKRTLARSPSIAGQALTEEEEQAILTVCNSSEYTSLPPGQVVPRLADNGIYIASESSFYRVLKKHKQNNRRGRVSPPKNRSKPDEVIATKPNTCWSWDITFLKSNIAGLFYKLYMILDVFSKKITGWEVHHNESAAHASVLVEKACQRENIQRNELILHADNGSPMKGATLLATLEKLGIAPSYSRPSVSNDNPYSESLFKTLKYSPKFPEKPFESIEQARQWVYDFVQWYNGQHRHSAIKYVTPNERHTQQDERILQHRNTVYKAAQRRHPNRWSGATRDWSRVDSVALNPDKDGDKKRAR